MCRSQKMEIYSLIDKSRMQVRSNLKSLRMQNDHEVNRDCVRP